MIHNISNDCRSKGNNKKLIVIRKKTINYIVRSGKDIIIV